MKDAPLVCELSQSANNYEEANAATSSSTTTHVESEDADVLNCSYYKTLIDDIGEDVDVTELYLNDCLMNEGDENTKEYLISCRSCLLNTCSK